MATARRVAARIWPGVWVRALSSTEASTSAACVLLRLRVSSTIARALGRLIVPASSAASVAGSDPTRANASDTRDCAVRADTRSIRPTSATTASQSWLFHMPLGRLAGRSKRTNARATNAAICRTWLA